MVVGKCTPWNSAVNKYVGQYFLLAYYILVDYILGKKVSIENRAATKKDTSTKKWTIQLVLLSSYVQKKTLGMPFTIIASRWAALKLNIAMYT